MYKIMTLDLKKLLLSRKQNYECVRRLFVFTKHSRKEQDAVHLSKNSPYTFIICFRDKSNFSRSKDIIMHMFTKNIPLLNNRRCYSNSTRVNSFTFLAFNIPELDFAGTR